jgi:hypothetical protein
LQPNGSKPQIANNYLTTMPTGHRKFQATLTDVEVREKISIQIQLIPKTPIVAHTEITIPARPSKVTSPQFLTKKPSFNNDNIKDVPWKLSGQDLAPSKKRSFLSFRRKSKRTGEQEKNHGPVEPITTMLTNL